MYKKISAYGIIGNLQSVALVGSDASIDWLCFPYIDSPSIFAALLDDETGGRFCISPCAHWTSSARYIPDTNILQTIFKTESGTMQVTDFMPVPMCGEEICETVEHELYRLVEVTEGRVKAGMIFDPRFDYARCAPSLERSEKFIVARGNSESLCLSCSRDMGAADDTCASVWDLAAGDSLWLHLRYGSEDPVAYDQQKLQKALRDTETYWKSWLKRSETGRDLDFGPYRQMINRSALVLKLLYYNPTGTIAAAATTSLPEEIGGIRNWDYRYTWVRDTSFTLQALFSLGHLSETEGYLRWIEQLLSQHGAEKMQIMYGLRGEEELPEQELGHLEGYRKSRPVRIGNSAVKQKQLDIYGELMDAALKLSNYVGKIDAELWPFLRNVVDYAADHWQDRDYGIWEIRGGPHNFVYSKVMCWVALDRGITIARRYGFHADLNRWEYTLSRIKNQVLEKGWSPARRSFVQHYDTDALDAGSLLIPLVGFLPFDDHRVVSTVDATWEALSSQGYLYRYISEDGLAGGEGTFLLCTFWMVNCLIGLNRLDEAEALLGRLEAVANHLGLFSEEYDTSTGEQLGNFPQAFTHIGYINCVSELIKARSHARPVQQRRPTARKFFFRTVLLNDGKPSDAVCATDVGNRLKESMNIMRGAFFDTEKGRIAYERIKGSNVYRSHEVLSYGLKQADLLCLRTREEASAFWVNLYNVIVIHGVVELGIRDSVKEVRNFFRRVQYQIGDMFFNPDDIEHGILRGNRPPPNALFKQFGNKDKRNAYSITPIDPRIHFALVCASSSCPPIAVYTAEKIDKELTLAGETFLNGGGLQVKRDINTVSLSRIFKWYGGDFGKNTADMLRFVARFVYDDADREFLFQHADTVTVTYQDYDWGLNR